MNEVNKMTMIKASQLTKEYTTGKFTNRILNNVNLEIEKGEFVSLMGPSGAGKSTLLYILGGLDKPTSGSVLLNGKNMAMMKDREESIMRRREIGFIFQFYNLIPNLNVEENILLPIILDGKNQKLYKDKLYNILHKVGLYEKRQLTPRELSGGQQQRVAIARALIGDPEIILADEPTGNLDSKSGTEILELLQKINLENEKTIVMVTHSHEAATYGKRIVVVKDGNVMDV